MTISINVERGGRSAEMPDGVPRIVEVDPTVGLGVSQLQDAAIAAGIEMASIHLRRNFENGWIVCCFRCGASTARPTKLKHLSSCPVGRFLAHVEALNDARMGVERPRVNRSLLPPRELHILTWPNGSGPGVVADHHDAALAHAAETPFVLQPVVSDVLQGVGAR